MQVYVIGRVSIVVQGEHSSQKIDATTIHMVQTVTEQTRVHILCAESREKVSGRNLPCKLCTLFLALAHGKISDLSFLREKEPLIEGSPLSLSLSPATPLLLFEVLSMLLSFSLLQAYPLHLHHRVLYQVCHQQQIYHGLAFYGDEPVLRR